MDEFMDSIRLPLGDIVSDGVDWLTSTLSGFFSVLRSLMGSLYDGLDFVTSTPPFWAVIIVLAIIAYFAKSWKLALGTVIGLMVIVSVDQWDNAMNTLALVIIASFIALIIAIPLGILAARNDTASKIIRPFLDFLQTMPAFVYLIPALMLFGVGVVPGIVATIVFALAPGVRLTELGIRGVDKEVVEAGYAFGSTPGKILRQIQLPLAMPSIMAGVNQVIMLALSMAVIAGIAGAPGLGQDIVQAMSTVDIATGVEAGIGVVVIAVFLDRLTGALGAAREHGSSLVSLVARRRATAAKGQRGLAQVA